MNIAQQWKARGEMPSMDDCDDNNWTEGYNALGDLVVVFTDGSMLTQDGNELVVGNGDDVRWG